MNQDELRKMIAADLKLDDLPVQNQEEIIASLVDGVVQKLTITVLQQIPENKVPELTKLTEARNEQAVFAFMQANVPHFEKLIQDTVASEVQNFKDFMSKK
jgi:hypothetical protein